jgi:hypothetical protein
LGIPSLRQRWMHRIEWTLELEVEVSSSHCCTHCAEFNSLNDLLEYFFDRAYRMLFLEKYLIDILR